MSATWAAGPLQATIQFNDDLDGVARSAFGNFLVWTGEEWLPAANQNVSYPTVRSVRVQFTGEGGSPGVFVQYLKVSACLVGAAPGAEVEAFQQSF